MIPKLITVHCSASPNGRNVTLETIDKWHQARGFSGCGYHYVIELSGEIKQGRSLNQQGAHVQGANKDNLGICMIGTDKFTEPQWMSLLGLITAAQNRWNIAYSGITCHYEYESAKRQGKTCPNFTVETLKDFLFKEDLGIVANHIFPKEGTKA